MWSTLIKYNYYENQLNCKTFKIMTIKDKILIIGGYGTVGSIVSKKLAMKYPSKIIVAGRNLKRAQDFIKVSKINAQSFQLDIENISYNKINYSEIDTIVCCVETSDISIILKCIEYDINYTEVGASYKTYQRFLKLEDTINNSKSLIIPSVGLVPGLSNIMVYNAAKKFKKIESIKIYVMLGLGEEHGLDAIRWMLDKSSENYSIKSANKTITVKGFTKPESVTFLDESSKRKLYLFNFSDQHTIPELIATDTISTRLCFDSKTITYLFYVLQKLKLLKHYKLFGVNQIKRFFDFLKVGSKKYSVQIEITGKNSLKTPLNIKQLITGNLESMATALVTSYTVEKMYKNETLKGLRRIEEVLEFNDLKEVLYENNIQILNQNG